MNGHVFKDQRNKTLEAINVELQWQMQSVYSTWNNQQLKGLITRIK